ncbi:hypothetical protein CDL15_Pgr028825 [Punica granatum]|uniref:7-deoxyloganetin glucosyltransferase-like n=1 Tax=Punica granatum TaxID=22663 RepID=A0A218WX90_PUNGR|nr:hypothetical protein CDL15_Pgr028825 [Punica granatum]PKI47419.1 hypothetical protein CRG98_032254 [Punica granatum]
MASDASSSMKPHAVCLPFSTQSHISAMVNLAKLLHHRCLYITFINTEFNYRRLLEAGDLRFLDNLPAGFQFMAIPDGLPPAQSNATQDIASLCQSARLFMGAPFCELIGKLNERAESVSGFPPVSCIMADSVMAYSADPASEEYRIPVVRLYTIAACALVKLMHLPKLKEKSSTPPNGTPC